MNAERGVGVTELSASLMFDNVLMVVFIIKSAIHNLKFAISSSRRRSFFSVFLLETLNTPGSVHQFLLAGEKRMARGTNFHIQLFLG